MIAANHQPQFLPYLGFFHKVSRSDVLVILDDVQFNDRGFQHRNLIKMQTGTQMLTVPVRKRRGQLIREVEIDPTSIWRKKHWAAIQTSYGRAAYFKPFGDELREIIAGGGHTHLLALDSALLGWAMAVLGLDVPVRLSSQLGGANEPNQRHIDLCRAVGADTYLSGPGGRLYMDAARFTAAGIEVRYQEYSPRPYEQLFSRHGFIPNLAVIDAIFNCGPAARELIVEPSPSTDDVGER